MEKKNNAETFQALVDVIKQLRDPEHGCPWDKEQTHESLKQYVIEEAYELVDAIDTKPDKVNEELGDVLLQVLLHSQIAAEQNEYDIYSVVENLRTKLIRRHPHVFGDVVAKTSEDVLKTWQKVKKSEQGALDGVPRALPALLRTTKITDRARRSELKKEVTDFSALENLAEKILNKDTSSVTKDEYKNALFQFAVRCHKDGYNPEELLQEACNEFTAEFQKLEK